MTTLRDFGRDVRLLGHTAYRQQRLRVLAITGLTLLVAASEGVGMVLLVPILQALDGAGMVTMSAPWGETSVPLWAVLAVMVTVIGIRVATQGLVTYQSRRLSQEISDSLRQETWRALIKARWEFLLRIRSGDVLHTVNTDANRVAVAVERAISGLGTILTAVALWIVAVILSPLLALIASVATLAVAAAAVPLLRRSHTLGRMAGLVGRKVMSTGVDVLGALRLIRVHQAEEVWLADLNQGHQDVRRVVLANQVRTAWTQGITVTGGALALAILVLFGFSAGLATATLLVFVAVFTKMTASANRVVQLVQMVANSVPALRQLTNLQEEAAVAAEAPTAKPIDLTDDQPPKLGVVSLSYRYPGQTEPVFTNLTAEFPRGQVTALVGPSGVGKSTLMDVLLGLLPASAGHVEWNDVPISAQDLAAHRPRLAYVPQEPLLVPGTVRANLAMGLDWEPAVADYASALTAAGVDFLGETETALAVQLGPERQLSGGEKQRLSLARAFLRQPKVLFLDEPTNALDARTHTQVLASVRGLTPKCTVILISHQPGSRELADHVVELTPRQVSPR